MNQHPTDRITDIILRHLEGSITDDERQELQRWMDASPLNKDAVIDFLDEANLQAGIRDMYHYRQKVWERVQQQAGIPKVIPIRRTVWWRYAAAAAILAFLVGGYFLFFGKGTPKDDVVIVEAGKDVKAPETNRAMITLADGRVVYLDSVANGQLALQGNVKLVKLANGQIAYQTASGEIVKELQYNTLSNPRGSKVIDMQFSDGSHVWLNAGSSVTYPIAFVGDERKVSITGEAYFEVAHNSTMPFYVSKGDVSVQVLGTHFNVNAYDDEADIKVTLLEGSVKVSKGAADGLLKPGQQAQVSSAIKIINAVDVEQVMAWKNGKFEFGESTSLEDIMRQVSRWYDVDIEYKGNFKQSFGGSISRQVNVSKVLEKFELTGRVHFKIEGRKIIVMP